MLTTSLHYNSHLIAMIHSYSDSKNFKKYDWAILEPVEERKLLNLCPQIVCLCCSTSTRLTTLIIANYMYLHQPSKLQLPLWVWVRSKDKSQEARSTCKAVLFTISVTESVSWILNTVEYASMLSHSKTDYKLPSLLRSFPTWIVQF